MRFITLTVLFVFALTAFAESASDQPVYDSAEELAGNLLDLGLPDLCAAYREPLLPSGAPRSPFETAAGLAEKRRAQAEEFRSYVAPYLIPAEGTRVTEFSALGRRVLGSATVPSVYVLDHARLCADEAGNRVELEAPGSAPAAKEAMRKALESECHQESYGRANAFANEIILGAPVAHHRNQEGATFAYLHELCHVTYPAIRNGYLEEIFCDAVASRWYREFVSDNVQGLAASVEEMLLPRNPYKEILVLRARLPALCLINVSP